jgi:hypothetical protein
VPPIARIVDERDRSEGSVTLPDLVELPPVGTFGIECGLIIIARIHCLVRVLHEIPRACNDARGRRKRNDSNGDTCDDKSTDATIVVVIANLALVANVHKASPSRRDAPL